MNYIDGKPYADIHIYTTDVTSQINNLKAEKEALEGDLSSANKEVTRLAILVETKNAEIITLNNTIKELEDGVVTPPPVEPPPIGELYFADNFEGSTTANLLGGWTDWKTKLPFVEGIYFNNSGSAPYVIQEIRQDAGKNVLYARINDDSPSGGTTRAQMTVDLKQDLPVIHTSHRMNLHPDIAYLTNYSGSIRWFTLFEMWNLRDSTQGGDPAGSSRVSFSLFKASGAGQPLFWHVAYEEMQPSESVKWQKENRTVVIPLGKWFTLDVSIKRGIGTAGNIKITIQEDGGQPITIFNENTNTVYRDKTNLYINQWQIFKLYAADQIMDFMRNAGKEISVMYNDVKWYKE